MILFYARLIISPNSENSLFLISASAWGKQKPPPDRRIRLYAHKWHKFPTRKHKKRERRVNREGESIITFIIVLRECRTGRNSYYKYKKGWWRRKSVVNTALAIGSRKEPFWSPFPRRARTSNGPIVLLLLREEQLLHLAVARNKNTGVITQLFLFFNKIIKITTILKDNPSSWRFSNQKLLFNM